MNVASTVSATVVGAALVLVALIAPFQYVFLESELLIAVLYAMSLNLLMGSAGMLSLGHSAYYAIASYASSLLLTRLGWPMGLAMIAGPPLAAAGALLFGAFIVRVSHRQHAYFLMLTLAFSQLIFMLIYKWYAVTRGDDGISGIDASGVLASPRYYCLFTLGVVAFSIVALHRIQISHFGLALQAIRDNPERASFVGLSTRYHQLLAFVIAGFFAGVSGTLYAFFSGTISPQIADWSASARPFLSNVIGGVQSFWGPALGVFALETIESQVGRFTEHSLLATGVLALLVGLYLPQGIVGLLRGVWERRRTIAERHSKLM